VSLLEETGMPVPEPDPNSRVVIENTSSVGAGWESAKRLESNALSKDLLGPGICGAGNFAGSRLRVGFLCPTEACWKQAAG
jgi:hypothetical protein